MEFKKIMKLIYFIVLFQFSYCFSKMINIPKNPFVYDLGVKIVKSKTRNDSLTICCHGYGHNNQIVDVVKSFNAIKGNLVGFNFPDYNIKSDADHSKCSYGTINEILPLLFLLKFYICEQKFSKVNLYGFSAGGGAIINALGILNKNLYESELKNIGILEQQRKQILNVLQKGIIILDCPLKSVNEIIAFRGESKELKALAANFNANKLNPIDNIDLLSGLKLNIILNLQNPDDVLSNRDDALFTDKLKKTNKGKTQLIFSSDIGHTSYHPKLWDYYKKYY